MRIPGWGLGRVVPGAPLCPAFGWVGAVLGLEPDQQPGDLGSSPDPVLTVPSLP